MCILIGAFSDSMVPETDMALFAALGNEDPAEESFEQLFEKMRLMKGGYRISVSLTK